MAREQDRRGYLETQNNSIVLAENEGLLNRVGILETMLLQKNREISELGATRLSESIKIKGDLHLVVLDKEKLLISGDRKGLIIKEQAAKIEQIKRKYKGLNNTLRDLYESTEAERDSLREDLSQLKGNLSENDRVIAQLNAQIIELKRKQESATEDWSSNWSKLQETHRMELEKHETAPLAVSGNNEVTEYLTSELSRYRYLYVEATGGMAIAAQRLADYRDSTDRKLAFLDTQRESYTGLLENHEKLSKEHEKLTSSYEFYKQQTEHSAAQNESLAAENNDLKNLKEFLIDPAAFDYGKDILLLHSLSIEQLLTKHVALAASLHVLLQRKDREAGVLEQQHTAALDSLRTELSAAKDAVEILKLRGSERVFIRSQETTYKAVSPQSSLETVTRDQLRILNSEHFSLLQNYEVAKSSLFRVQEEYSCLSNILIETQAKLATPPTADDRDSHISSLADLIKSLQETNSAIQTQLKVYKEDYSRACSLAKHSESALTQLQNKYREEVSQFHCERTNLYSSCEALNKQLETAKRDWREDSTRLNSHLETYKLCLARTGSIDSVLESTQLQAANAELQGTISALKDDIQHRECEVAELEKFRDKFRILNVKIHSYHTKNNELKETQKTHQQTVDALNTELAALKDSEAQKQLALAKVQQELEAETEKTQRERRSAQGALQELSATNSALSQLQSQLQSQTLAHTAETEQLQSSFAAELLALTTANESLRASLENQDTQNDDTQTMQNQQTEIEQLKTDHLKTESELRALQLAHENTAKELQQKTNELNFFFSNRESTEQENSKLKEELNKLQELTTTQGDSEELESLRNSLQQLGQEKDKKIESLRQQFQIVKDALQKRKSDKSPEILQKLVSVLHKLTVLSDY